MFIDITDKCTMECTHCMLNCKASNNNFMTQDTLEKIFNTDFFKNAKTFNISGGEPTEHPDFFRILDRVLEKTNNQKVVTVISNGLWAYIDGYKEMLLERLDKHPMLFVQVTHDPDFYPYNIKWVDHQKILKEDHVENLDRLGRAKNLDEKFFKSRVERRLGPSCFNYRSVLKDKKSLVETSYYLESIFKFCNTVFLPNGDFSPCECNRWIVGNIHDENFIESATAKALKTIIPCNECGDWDKAAPMLKDKLTS